MLHLRITALELTNYGPFCGRHRFSIPDSGLAIYREDNEVGKTTMLEAVAATLWGTARVARNWQENDGRSQCAAIEFERYNGDSTTRLRVERDFETHKVVCSELREDGSRAEHYRGTHNPNGHTADNKRWPENVLPEIWPILCAEFTHLAMLCQPLPPDIDASLLQRLIAGAGETTINEAKKCLSDRFRTLSKNLRGAGLGKRNAQKDGQLDESIEKRTQLMTRIAESSGALDQIQKIRDRLDQVRQEEERLVRDRKQKEKELETIDQWLKLREKLEGVRRRSKQLADAAAEIAKANKEVADADRDLGRLPPELRELDVAGLEALQTRADCYRQWTGLKQRFSDVWNWPEDAADIAESLERAIKRCDDAKARRDAVVNQLAAAVPQEDGNRRRLISGLTGLVVAVVVALTTGFFWGWIAGAFAGAISFVIAAFATYVLYRPTKPNPAYEPLQRECHEAERHLASAHQSVEAARARIAWTDETDLPCFLQRSERRRTLNAEIEQIKTADADYDVPIGELEARLLAPPLAELLRQRGNRIKEVLSDLTTAKAAIDKRNSANSRIASVLKAMDCEDIPQLEQFKQEYDDRRIARLKEMDTLKSTNALAKEVSEMGGQAIEARLGELDQRLAETQSQLGNVGEEVRRETRELDKREAVSGINVAHAQSELAQVTEEIDRLRRRCDAIAKAHELLQEAAKQFSAHHRECIEQRINELLKAWSGHADRRITVDAEFALGLVVTANGVEKTENLACLSQGARDQLALAARIAALERIGGDAVLPLLVDDAFLTWDENRRHRLQQVLKDLAGERQIIMVSHDQALEEWGEPIVRRSGVVAATVSALVS